MDANYYWLGLYFIFLGMTGAFVTWLRGRRGPFAGSTFMTVISTLLIHQGLVNVCVLLYRHKPFSTSLFFGGLLLATGLAALWGGFLVNIGPYLRSRSNRRTERE